MKLATSALLALILAACSSGARPSPIASPAATATDTPTSRPSTRHLTPAPMTVTGFGALDADWNTHHTADPRGCAGCLYNLSAVTPGNDEYFAVGHDSGRVTGYNLELPANTSLAAAEKRAKAEVPFDAKVLWSAKRDTCEQMELQSPTLGRLLSSLGDPSGQVYVELYTIDPTTGDASLDARSVNEGLFGLGSFPQARDAPAC